MPEVKVPLGLAEEYRTGYEGNEESKGWERIVQLRMEGRTASRALVRWLVVEHADLARMLPIPLLNGRRAPLDVSISISAFQTHEASLPTNM